MRMNVALKGRAPFSKGCVPDRLYSYLFQGSGTAFTWSTRTKRALADFAVCLTRISGNMCMSLYSVALKGINMKSALV